MRTRKTAIGNIQRYIDTDIFFLCREYMILIVRATGVPSTANELGSICTTMTAPTSRYHDGGIKGLML